MRINLNCLYADKSKAALSSAFKPHDFCITSMLDADAISHIRSILH